MNTVLAAMDLNKYGSSDFWTSQFSNFTPATVALCLVLALVTGLLISFVYKITYRGVLYSPQFSMVLIMLTLITAPVVMAIGSDVALSMGMVGALSIVRFRTAVKEPLDTCYMFWSITMGILLGAKQYAISLVVAVGIGIILILLSFIKMRHPNAYLMVVHYDPFAEPDILDEVRRHDARSRVRSKTVTRSGAEITIELLLRNRTDIVGHMLDLKGVHDATLVACQNETGA